MGRTDHDLGGFVVGRSADAGRLYRPGVVALFRPRPGALFAISVLAADQSEIANRFAARVGLDGAERLRQGRWTTTPGGVPAPTDALAAFECEAEELIERHSNVILIGRVRFALPRASCGALVYWRGGYDQVGWSAEQISRAIGVTPA